MTQTPTSQPASQPASQIVHESETQRQHVRLPFPAHAEIAGQEHEVKDLSSGGVGVKGVTGEYKRGQHILLRLKLPFGAFSLDVNLDAEIRHYDAKEKLLGCVFVSLTADQISLLNYLLKSFMAGDIVGSGDILSIASRDNFTKPRNKGVNAAGPDLKRQIPGLLLIGSLGLLIATFILANIYNSLFVVKANDAVITGSTVDITAVAGGIYHAKLDPGVTLVQPDQLIATVTPADGRGEAVDIKSPCQCYIVGLRVSEGEYLPAGASLGTLVPLNAKLWVSAEVDPSQAVKVGMDTQATITVLGSNQQYAGRVVSMSSGMASGSATGISRPIIMKIAADQKIPVDLANRPASVVFSVH